jgi:hypothetical protein|tara:strand:- start:58 stop:864 length:807 start_codon:yes stop_codon:yes gene_type:complete
MYLAAFPLQLPEVKRVISHYYNKIYDHNSILKDRFDIQEKFIKKFIPWINKGHMKFVGLKDFKYVYITNGVTEAIHTTMIEHSLRPMTQKDEYPGYFAHAKVLRESNIELKNRIKVLSLPFYNSGLEHPTTIKTLEENSFIDCAWAAGSGIKKTYDVSKVGYVAFSFSKMFGMQYHRVGILFSKKPVKTLDIYKEKAYVNLAGVDLINQLMSFSPSYFYDKYKHISKEICKNLGVEETPSLWIGSKDGKKVPLINEWLEYEKRNTRIF